MTATPRSSTKRRRTALILTAGCLAVALSKLSLDWWFRLEQTLTREFDAATVPSTALCFVLLCLAVHFASRDAAAGQGRKPGVTLGLCGAVILVAGANLAILVVLGDHGIDQMLGLGIPATICMASGTSVGLILAAICTLMLGRRPTIVDFASLAAAACAAGIISARLMEPAADLGPFAHTSLTTGFMFLALFEALFLLSLDLQRPPRRNRDRRARPRKASRRRCPPAPRARPGGERPR